VHFAARPGRYRGIATELLTLVRGRTAKHA
jgi:hypothetical protein